MEARQGGIQMGFISLYAGAYYLVRQGLKSGNPCLYSKYDRTLSSDRSQ
jgi:hypothetical protein